MKAGELERPNSLLRFFVCRVILKVHTDFQDGGQSIVVLRIARLFFVFVENRTKIYSKFDKKRLLEPCPASTVQFMAVVRVEEREESEFARSLCQRMMHTEDGVMTGKENSKKPGKSTRTSEGKLKRTRFAHVRSILTPRILKYVSMTL